MPRPSLWRKRSHRHCHTACLNESLEKQGLRGLSGEYRFENPFTVRENATIHPGYETSYIFILLHHNFVLYICLENCEVRDESRIILFVL